MAAVLRTGARGSGARGSHSSLAAEARGLAGWQCIGGALLLARPRTIARRVGGTSPPPLLVQLLGARMLAQGLLESARPTRAVLLAGCGVDAAHALSMLAAAVRFPDYRRPALTSGTAAAVAAGLGAAIARSKR
jgi:hypothetical protein